MKWYRFSEVVTDATSNFTKIKASDYHAQGKYKIIDQGKDPIAGYTDDANLVNGHLLPILIFGDHTRVLKYESDPIALGADGAKALWVNSELANARYVYYYLRSIQIKEAGYSRHFKFLKEVKIPIPFKDGAPALDDQIRIAHLLGKVEGLIAQRKQHSQQLDDLLKSVFLEMFGDPVRNEKGWDIHPCEKAVLAIASGTSYGGEERAFVSGDEVGVLKISAVTKGAFDSTEFKVVNPAQITKVLRFVKGGDFLFSRANTVELVAACCVVPHDYNQLFLPDKLWVLTLNPELINPQFFNYLLKNERYRDVVRSLASGGHDSMLNISMKKFMTLDVPCPPVDIQNQFAVFVEKVEGLKSRYQQSLTDLEDLYGGLSQQAFKGELDLSRVLLSAELAQPSHDKQQEKTERLVLPKQVIAPSKVINHLMQATQSTAERRSELLARWLKQYLTNTSPDASFGSAQFLESAWQLIQAAQFESDGETPALTLDDYDALKDLIFEKLGGGDLVQTFDADNNRVALQKQHTDFGTW